MAVAFIRPGPLEQIVTAVEDRLQIAFPTSRFVYQWMPARLTPSNWRDLTRKLPMVALGFNHIRDSQRTENFAGVTGWSVYLATQNEAGPRARFMGDAQAPGLASLIQVGAAVLNGFTIPGVGTVEVSDVNHVVVDDFTEDRIGIVAIDFSIKADLGIAKVLSGDGVTPPDLTSHVIQWAFGSEIVQTDTITGPI